MPQSTICRGNIIFSEMLSINITPTSVNANTTAEQAFTVQGLQVNDFVDVYAAAAQTAGIGIVNNRVSAANTLQIGFANTTGGSLTPVAGVYLLNVTRAEGVPMPNSIS